MSHPTDGRRRSPTVSSALAAVAMAAAVLLAACGSPDAMADAEPGSRDQTALSEPERAGPNRSGGTRRASDDAGHGGPALDRLTYADERGPIDPGNVPYVAAPQLESPEQRLPRMTPEQAHAIEKAAASPDLAILDVAGIVEDGPSAGTSSGELVILDEPAGLACADIEIALTDIDRGALNSAEDHIVSAADRSSRSGLDAIRSWSSTLSGSVGDRKIEAAPLVGFLSVCLDGGYVL